MNLLINLWSRFMAVLYMWKRRQTDRPGWEVKKNPGGRSEPQFVVKRRWFTDEATISDLIIDGFKKCFILEDPVRIEKIPNVTAIPEGTYELIISYSNRFKKHLPLLLNVPNFKGIRMHPGNTADDTSGCLLPGIGKSEDNKVIFYSRKAFTDVFELLKVMCAHEKVWIKIVNEREDNA